MSALVPFFKNGFVCGLPLAFFHITLLRQPVRPVIRRRAGTEVNGKACLPSWSWAGWQCHFNHLNWTSAMDYIKHHRSMRCANSRSERVIPHVKWYAHHDLATKGAPIGMEWYKYRTKYLSPDNPPPPGWTKHAITEGSYECGDSPEFDGIPKCFYKPEFDPETECWYPVPLPHPGENKTPNLLASFLSCQTHRAWLFGGEREKWSTIQIFLNDKAGICVGKLTLLKGSPSNARGSDIRNDILRQPVELIEISCGSVRDGKSDELYGIPCPQQTEMLLFYHVMWIEWEDGVAYRKGLGSVLKEAWKAQDLEEISLVSG
jgi:hypothetical protein